MEMNGTQIFADTRRYENAIRIRKMPRSVHSCESESPEKPAKTVFLLPQE
jgi:hypothetical protein